MADLAGVAVEMSLNCGLDRAAQEHYALALRCAYAGAILLSARMSWLAWRAADAHSGSSS
jgi:hypothetical protein